MLVARFVQTRHHGPRASALSDLAEAVALVEPQRRIVRLHAQRDLFETVVARLRKQRFEQLVAEALPAAGRDDGDRKLGRLLVDEAVARLLLLEQPVPRRADVSSLVAGDHGGVAGPAEVHDVALHRTFQGVLVRHSLTPVIRVVEHVAEEARVVSAPGSNHGETRSCASWTRLPSGSKTSTRRTCPCSSSTVPTSTPTERNRSASAFTSSTSTCATPPSSGSPSASAISISPCLRRAQRDCQSTYVSAKPSVSR